MEVSRHPSRSSQRAFVPRLASGRRAPRGFTLVELLTVIVIIGILAGLIAAAVVAAVNRAKEARVVMEIKSLEASLMAYSEKYGDVPPDVLSDANRVEAHLRRAFPRYAQLHPTNLYTQFCTDVSASCGLNPSSVSDSSTALVFWLGGINRNGSGTPWIPNGFSVDVEHPFMAGGPRLDPFFQFDPERIEFGGGRVRYFPEIAGAMGNCPYIYFRARTDGYNSVGAQSIAHSGITEQVLPYRNGQTGDWAAPKSLQIISAGRDNFYGDLATPPTFPGNLTPEHYDNLTNFAEGRLENEIQ